MSTTAALSLPLPPSPSLSNVHTFFSRSLFLTEQQQQTEEEGEEQQQPAVVVLPLLFLLISFQFISILFAIVVAFSLPQVSFRFVVVCTYVCTHAWFFIVAVIVLLLLALFHCFLKSICHTMI